MFEWLQVFLDWYVDNINYWTIMLFMAIESSIVPFPAELIVPPAAWKAANGELNIILVVVFSTVGSVLGALFNYFLAYALGKRIIYAFAESKLGKLMMLSNEKIQKAEDYFLKYGNISTFIGRLTPGVRSFISLPAGIVKMPMVNFVIYTALGAGLWNIVLAALGYFLYSQKDLIEENFKLITIITIIIGFGFFTYLIVKGIRKKRNSVNTEYADN